MLKWLEGAIRCVSNGLSDRMDNKKFNVIVYRVKDDIRIDIK